MENMINLETFADGGSWRNQAILGIKEYLKEALKDNENVEIIA
ncbi:hypothetical protein [Clostridium cadaveris]|nr:hypothetical protein [Clostridium cadaveris]